jgi:anti-sigma factor RsiW
MEPFHREGTLGHQEMPMLVERYVLNELTTQEREEFEAHLFRCPSCAEDLEALFTFIANLRAAFEGNGK